MTLRPFMWVAVGNRVGILVQNFITGDRMPNAAAFSGVGEADSTGVIRCVTPCVEVHYTNDKGETVGGAFIKDFKGRQAKLSEIPKARRPDEATAKRLGYV